MTNMKKKYIYEKNEKNEKRKTENENETEKEKKKKNGKSFDLKKNINCPMQ
jgi:hypothetical protein